MKKLGASSRNGVKILKANINQINIFVISMEAGAHLDISKVRIAIQKLMTFKFKEDDINHSKKYLQTQLVPAL